MATLTLTRGASPEGRQFLERLRRRGEGMFDTARLAQVQELIAQVRRGGDGALLDAVRKLDGVDWTQPEQLRLSTAVGPEEVIPEGFEEALELAIEQVTAYHRLQCYDGFRVAENGITWIERRQPTPSSVGRTDGSGGRGARRLHPKRLCGVSQRRGIYRLCA